MIIFAAFCFGLILGSFLNVVIYRLPRDKSLVWPSSRCPQCGTPIKFYDNVPLLSFLLLGGKCRACRKPISPRYPVIEALTGAVTALFFMKHGQDMPWLIASLAAAYALIALSVIDLDFMIIPDELSLGLLGLGVVTAFVNPNFEGSLWWKLGQSLIGGATGFCAVWALAVAGEWLFKKEAMGGGDLKLMAGIGALTGCQGALSTLLIGSFFGALYGVALLIAKKAGRKDPIPFGPFLSLAALINLYRLIPLSAFMFPG